MHLDLEEISLDGIVQAAMNELSPRKNERKLSITTEGLERLPLIQGDKDRLQQVFWNLLSNAIKFTPDGGSIIVKGWNSLDELHADNDFTPQSDRTPKSDSILLAVRDTGVGVAPAEQEEIFEQFYIVGTTNYHSSSKTAFGGGGMGLGLPIARGILSAHRGRIWVESSGRNSVEYPGSTFYISLPR